MGEGIILKEVFGQLLIGAGGAGGTVLLALLFLFFKSNGNTKRIEEEKKAREKQEEECKAHLAITTKQDKMLVKIDTNQKNMIETQKKIFEKVDKLYDHQINGKKGK